MPASTQLLFKSMQRDHISFRKYNDGCVTLVHNLVKRLSHILRSQTCAVCIRYSVLNTPSFTFSAYKLSTCIIIHYNLIMISFLSLIVLDIDECSRPNNCSQLCNNAIGSFECKCRIGFKINPNITTECTGNKLKYFLLILLTKSFARSLGNN